MGNKGKIFVGYIETMQGKYGEFESGSFNQEDLDRLKSHMHDGRVRFTINTSKKGTKYITISTWKPTKKKEEVVGRQQVDAEFERLDNLHKGDDINLDEIPF